MPKRHVKTMNEYVIYRQPYIYGVFACITRLQNGEYFVVFNHSFRQEGHHMHPPTDPNFRAMTTRSADGVHWEAPRVAPSYEFSGTEVPSVMQLCDGALLFFQWKYDWYPLETARVLLDAGQQNGETMICDRETGQWFVPHTDADWERAKYPWAKDDAGAFIHRSYDDGKTWTETIKVNTAPFLRGYSPRPPIELADGTIMLALDDRLRGREVSYVVFSYDGAKTFGRATQATPRMEGKCFIEPTVVQTASGKILMVARNRYDSTLFQVESRDNGRTWENFRQTPIWGCPAHVIRLRNDDLLVVYGHRRNPFGIRACISRDEGETWDYENEIIIRDDMKNNNLGYPTVLEEEDGKIYVAWYGEDADGVTYVRGTRFDLP